MDYSSLCPQTCDEKREDYPKGISQEVADGAGSVGDKGLMDFIGQAVKYADEAKDNIDAHGIIEGRVPWIGGKHKGEAQEEIGGAMEKEIIKGDHLERKLYFFQGGHIEYGRCRKECGECVSGLSQSHTALKS
jgi:hypothetical protein